MNGRKTGGRRRGTRNKRTIALEHDLAQQGGVAIPYLRSVVMDEHADPQLRMRAAAALAPYEQARLLAIMPRDAPKDAVDPHAAHKRLEALLAPLVKRYAENPELYQNFDLCEASVAEMIAMRTVAIAKREADHAEALAKRRA